MPSPRQAAGSGGSGSASKPPRTETVGDTMKLSEKLAALEEQDRKSAKATGAAKARAGDGRARTRSRSAVSWDASKRKVRELVLTDVAPRIRGLSGDALTNEVKTALDKILQREDVKVSPLERRKFVQEVIQDTLGYGPLDPLLDDNSLTDSLCNRPHEIWIERAGK